MREASDSETILHLLLERRFGAAWLHRWLALGDAEARWLAIALADEAARHPAADLLAIIAEGRRALPAPWRTARHPLAVLTLLVAAGLWPPAPPGGDAP